MDIDQKVRIGFWIAAMALSGLAALAAAHGIFLGPLDGIGGNGHS